MQWSGLIAACGGTGALVAALSALKRSALALPVHAARIYLMNGQGFISQTRLEAKARVPELLHIGPPSDDQSL